MRALVLAQIRSRLVATLSLAFGGFALMLVIGVTYETFGTGLLGGAGKDGSAALDAFGGPGGTDVLSPAGWIGLGYNHPIMLVIAMASGVAIGSGAVAGMVDSGQAEMLFTRPVRRSAFLAAAVGVWIVSQTIVLTGAGLGAVLGGAFMAPIRGLGLWRLVLALPELLALGAFVGAIAVLASTMSRTPGRAIAITVAVAVVAYLLSFMSGLSASLDWLRWATPFGYVDPGGAISGGLDVLHVLVLAALAGLAYVAALAQVTRRDLV
jgi:ABC-2 type transport system permease protein